MTKTQSRRSTGFPISEYFVAGAGCTLIVAVIGFLLWTAIRDNDGSMQIVTSLDKVTPHSQGYWARVSIRNTGSQTASHLKLQATLKTGDTVAVREVQVDYLPPHSEKYIGLFFSNEPTSATLEVIPLSYLEP